jgi:DNA polymerase-3 subunit beta
MKVKITKDALLNGTQIVQNVIITKASLPILSNVLVETQQGGLRLTATDLDIGITCLVPVDIQEEGAVTIPAKRFSDIIKELPGDLIQITTKKNNQVNIEAGLCQFKIMGLAREEFPRLPEFKDQDVVRLEQGDLKEMLRLTSFSVSTDESRYILNGILFKVHKNTLTLVATDGKRLAVIEKKLSSESNKDINIIVPIKTVHELNRNLKDSGDLSLVLGGNQALFELGNITVVSRLIEGEFPDYKQVIPPETNNKMHVNREALLLAVKRAALLSTPDYQAVKLEVFKNKLVVSKSTPDIGESREEVQISYQGKELAIGFNPNYLADALKNLNDESVGLELTDSEKPGVIRINGYTYIVLPMRLS